MSQNVRYVVVKNAPVRPDANGFGIAGFVTSILGLMTCGLISPVALLLSACGMLKRPRGFAIAGTVLSLIGMLPLFFLVAVFTLRVDRANAIRERELARVEQRARIARIHAEFEPAAVNAEMVDAFPALALEFDRHHVGGASISTYTLEGRQADSAQRVAPGLRQIAVDPRGPTYYGITQRQMGTIDVSTGDLTTTSLGNLFPEFGRPTGIAFDTTRRRVLVAGDGGNGHLLVHDSLTGSWQPLAQLDQRVAALTYAVDDDCLFAIPVDFQDRAISRIVRLSPHGEVLGEIAVKPPIPIRDGDDKFVQLCYASYHLMVVLPPPADDDSSTGVPTGRVFAIQPDTGEVFISQR